jgi:hypothetical protein
MSFKWMHAVCALGFAGLVACGGGGSSTGSVGTTPGDQMQQTGTVSMMVSDAPSDDWALIGVKIENIALVPQGGGANVTVYSVDAASAPYVNLVELDQLSEILGNLTVPVGAYVGAVLTVGGNPGDVLLTTSADPESGFAGPLSTPIAASAIQIQHTQGASGSRTVPIAVKFDSPLEVSANSSNALDLEFDLSHPAFIIAHQPPGAGSLLWAVNFVGPVHRHPIADVTRLVLRRLYGTVTANNGSSITVNKDYAVYPPAKPETDVETQESLTIDVDATNGTLFYDVDTKSGPTKITSFADVSALAMGEFLRIQARYQEDGTLVATRIWASSSFNSVWVSPEGHVLDVDSAGATITVTNELGLPVTVDIASDTNFYFHGGATAIGTGPAFLTNLVRGFKVHVDVADPLAATFTAQDVDIETAEFSGAISGADTASFTYTRDFVRAADDYTQTLDYVSPSVVTGSDGSGNTLTGFYDWPFAYPTLTTSGASAIGDFVLATQVTPTAYGFTAATWADPTSPSGWFAPWVDLLPEPLALATVASPLSQNDQFTLVTVASGTSYTVDVSAASGSATLVYQVDRSGGVLTVSPVDITTQSGFQTFSQALTDGTPVKVYGVPQADGTLRGYVILYFSGDMPSE